MSAPPIKSVYTMDFRLESLEGVSIWGIIQPGSHQERCVANRHRST